MADRDEIQRIAAAMHEIRTDWPTRSLVTFLEKNLAAKTYRDLLIAGVTVASDPRTKTPHLLLEHGAWWVAAHAATGGGTPTAVPAASDPRCTVYGHEHYRLPCVGCLADERAARFEAEQAAGVAPEPFVGPDQLARNAHGARTVLAAAPIDSRRLAAGERDEDDE